MVLWGRKLTKTSISAPQNFRHHVHVKVDAKTGKLIGLPKQWINVVELETLNRRNPVVSAEQMSSDIPSHAIVGASASLSPSTSFYSGIYYENGSCTSTDTPIVSPPLSRPLNFKSRTFSSRSIENVFTALNDMVDKVDPRNDLCNVSVLGSGSSSTVLQVYQTSSRRTMALKRIIIKNQQRPELIINELTVMKRCVHRNIIEFHNSYLVGDEVWILMNMATNGSLTNFLMKKRLSEETISTISKQSINGIKYLHSQGIVHRDIKSDSILFASDWIVKLSDFGHSTILTEQFPKRRSLLGTPYWLAPEVANREPYGHEVDVWSYGITVIEMIVGQPPHYDDIPSVAISAIKNGKAPTIPPDYKVSSSLRSFVESMLVKEPAERATTATLLEHNFLELALKDPTQIQL